MKPKQVSVRLLASANNVAAAQLLLTAGRAAIDRYLLPAGPAAANPPPKISTDLALPFQPFFHGLFPAVSVLNSIMLCLQAVVLPWSMLRHNRSVHYHSCGNVLLLR